MRLSDRSLQAQALARCETEQAAQQAAVREKTADAAAPPCCAEGKKAQNLSSKAECALPMLSDKLVAMASGRFLTCSAVLTSTLCACQDTAAPHLQELMTTWPKDVAKLPTCNRYNLSLFIIIAGSSAWRANATEHNQSKQVQHALPQGQGLPESTRHIGHRVAWHDAKAIPSCRPSIAALGRCSQHIIEGLI